jgi:uncharacterized delta-60 repeat protein
MTNLNLTRNIAVTLLVLASSVALARDGDFDPSFNRLGFTRDFIPDFSGAGGVAIHATGEIVTAGFYLDSGTATYRLVLWRHLPDGTLDSTFGGTGVIYPPTPVELVTNTRDLAIDNQGRIVMLALTATTHVVYRFNFDGSPDLSFAQTGSITIPFGVSLFPIIGVAIQSDDKIVGVGSPNVAIISPFVVYRVQETGELDPSFGGTGIVSTQITPGGGTDRSTGVAIQADGKIVVAGRAAAVGSFFDFALARYLPTGDLDSSFGDGGKVVFSILDNDYGRKLVVQPDGKIAIVGSVCVGVGDIYCYAGAARVTDQGALDLTFGGSGTVYTDLGAMGGSAFDVALQLDNRIVVAGQHQWRADRSAENAILIRYRSDGSLDPLFGLNGISETNYGYVLQEAGEVRVQSDGQIVVSGFTSGSSPSAGVTARYLGSSSAPSTAGAASGQMNAAR